jgi:DNA-binding HxlR family transcriptional regulator
MGFDLIAHLEPMRQWAVSNQSAVQSARAEYDARAAAA